ncbi:MAG: flavodoxin-dependent (E)-4-hydroxy-3-methylbut-2-enyl-diphosphate synthase [Dehalococcoidia bacterium]|nr:flavodoxin-dependent (E)-4-hydroxy-3-methylbut-2-enyl-diphosphate synthase [Dehalococcoidia bacterium]
MIKRRISKPVQIGNVMVGGNAPVVVQSMTKTDTRDVPSTINQICELQEYGCELIRIAIPDMEAAQAVSEIKKGVNVPVIADIHFDYRLALATLKNGIDALRLNPGNIGNKAEIKAVVKAAHERGIPIRIGVNTGSMPKNSIASTKTPIVEQMVKIAMNQVHLLESMDFNLIKISLKAFDVPTTVEAYKSIANKTSYPLHIGITESGPPPTGDIRSAVGTGILLSHGIGDTIRVSLTATPHEEVTTAYEILKALNLREYGPTLVSCPTCGRCEVDLVKLALQVAENLRSIHKPIKVAVMGCMVNGPGEAKDADIGIACGKGQGILFCKGKRLRTVSEEDLLTELFTEIEKLI